MKYKLLLFFLGSLAIFAQTSTPPTVGDGSVGNPYKIPQNGVKFH